MIKVQGRTSASAFLELQGLPMAAVHRPRSAGAPCSVLSVYLFRSRAGRDACLEIEVRSCCRGTNEEALWDVHTSRRSNSFGGRAAYAGEDGELTMALQAWCQDNRQRASHYVYAGGRKSGAFEGAHAVLEHQCSSFFVSGLQGLPSSL